MMPLTRSQGEALTALLHQLRHDWDLPGIRSALHRASTLGAPAEIATAACRVAANPQARTPALIPEPGQHWQGTAAGKAIAPVRCPDHPQRKAGNCPDCEALAVPKPATFTIPRRDKHQHPWVPQEEA